MSNLQDTLSKLCCCFDIEYGGFIVGVTRLVLHLTRVMIAIILLMGGIMEGVETTTEFMTTGGNDGASTDAPTTELPPLNINAATATDNAVEALDPEDMLYELDRHLTKYQMKTMRDCKNRYNFV